MAHDGELVTTEPRETVASAKHSLDALGHDGEQLVAGLMPEAVVHDLEVVDVEHDESDAFVLRRAQDCVVQPLDEHHAVRQLGERVVACTVRELVFERSVRSDFLRRTKEIAAPPVGIDDRCDIDRDRTARIRTAPLGLECDRTNVASCPRERAHMRHQGLGRQHGAHIAVRQIGVDVAEQRAVRRVRVDEAEGVVVVDCDHERGVRQRVEQRCVGRDRRHRPHPSFVVLAEPP